MIELHKLVKDAMMDVALEYGQDHIRTQLKNLFENVLTDNYDNTDINLLIEKIRIQPEESDGK
jgi:hypothetical protein